MADRAPEDSVVPEQLFALDHIRVGNSIGVLGGALVDRMNRVKASTSLPKGWSGFDRIIILNRVFGIGNRVKLRDVPAVGQ